MLRTRKRRDRAGGNAEMCCEEFNRKFPAGSRLHYRETLPFDPPKEAVVCGAAFVADSAEPVVFLKGISGYVSIFHCSAITEQSSTQNCRGETYETHSRENRKSDQP